MHRVLLPGPVEHRRRLFLRFGFVEEKDPGVGRPGIKGNLPQLQAGGHGHGAGTGLVSVQLGQGVGQCGEDIGADGHWVPRCCLQSGRPPAAGDGVYGCHRPARRRVAKDMMPADPLQRIMATISSQGLAGWLQPALRR
jgi:hypothetical protein